MLEFLRVLCQHTTPSSLIWLHDGLWVSPPLPADITQLAANLAANFLGFQHVEVLQHSLLSAHLSLLPFTPLAANSLVKPSKANPKYRSCLVQPRNFLRNRKPSRSKVVASSGPKLGKMVFSNAVRRSRKFNVLLNQAKLTSFFGRKNWLPS